MAESLTPTERTLVEHVEQGKLLDLTGDSQTVRASVIRDIMRGRLAPDPDPHGLRLRGASIIGRLDLANITSSLPLKLSNCLLAEGLDARHAQLTTVTVSSCRLESPLDATNMTVTVLDISGATITVHSELGAVNVYLANLGVLVCSGATLSNDAGPALIADRPSCVHAGGIRGDRFRRVRYGPVDWRSPRPAGMQWRDLTQRLWSRSRR